MVSETDGDPTSTTKHVWIIVEPCGVCECEASQLKGECWRTPAFEPRFAERSRIREGAVK
jgi:hypothetical protein